MTCAPHRCPALFRRPAFTLIELLVVISIIALLIGILLPALGAARDSARNVKCLSQTRQMSIAANSFAADHKGYMQTSSSDLIWTSGTAFSINKRVLRNQDKFKSNPDRITDWATSIARYMGQGDFDLSDADTTEAFICPDDPSMSFDDPGLRVYNNISDSATFQPISYGINADVTAIAAIPSAGPRRGLWTSTDLVRPYIASGSPLKSLPLEGLLEATRDPSSTMLFADMGVRQADGTPAGNSILAQDTLAITSTPSFGVGGSLGDYYRTGGTNVNKLPISEVEGGARHPSDGINVAFVDGHSASAAGEAGWDEVKLSPLY